MNTNGQTKNLEETLTGLTLKQVRVLLRIMEAPARTMMFKNSNDAGVISSLSKLNLVEPRGKVGSATMWRVAEPVFKDYRSLIRSIHEGGETINV